MVQVSHTREGAVVDGDTVTVTCDCEWTGEVTLYDIGDGPEWCCPQCDHCILLSELVEVDEFGLTPAMRKFKDEAEAWWKARREEDGSPSR